MSIKKKRVATLYRVSTKGQLDGNDITMQVNACQEFIKKHDWDLVKEYYEKGVSGYKISAANRDVIKQAKCDAENGLFDVLLVFMFDRLGRRDDETPFIVQWFVNNGVEMWSVKEGEQRFDDHNDKLINYLRFWLSNGESRKTSIRVSEKHSQMVLEGIYRGGTVPYGYYTKKSGKYNKKGKELLEVLIDEEQAKIVRKMYELVYEEGYGQYRIAQYLNDNGYPSKTGKKWTSAAVNNVLSNTIYKGFMKYAKGTKHEVISNEQIKDLVIIDEVKWGKVQTIREKRSPKNTKNTNENCVIKTTKGSLLLVGMAKCGHCNNPLCTTYNKKRYVNKNGTTKDWRVAKYRCSGKAQKKVDCDGQTVHSPKKIEGIVLEEVFGYLAQLNSMDFSNEIKAFKKKNSRQEEKELNKLQTNLEEHKAYLVVLNQEVPKAIMGKSDFQPKLLGELINSKEKEIEGLINAIENVKKELESKKIEKNEMENFTKFIPVWKDVFESSSVEKKKMMLSAIIETVHVFRDSIEIKFKIQLAQFLGVMDNSLNKKHPTNELNLKVLTHSSMKNYK